MPNENTTTRIQRATSFEGPARDRGMSPSPRPVGQTTCISAPSRGLRLLLVALASSLAADGGLEAQERPSASVAEAKEDVRIDGVLDEPSWSRAIPLDPLTMIEPVEGQEPTAATQIRVMADARNLYVGIRALDDDPTGIVSYSKARDSQLRSEDHIKIILDPYLDGQSGYVFAINPGGARYDALVADQGLGENPSWDAVWEAATAVSPEGWAAEIRIPVQSITFDRSLDAWGFNVERRVQRRLEVSRWASPRRDALLAQTNRAGLITDLPRFDQGVGLTVRPALVGDVERVGPDGSSDAGAEPSLDVFQRIGSNATAVLTVNTDFAETEVDTRRTNLTRFPLFFPEKRTFFLEGVDIFDFGAGLTTFHSPDIVPFFTRRIGLYEGEEVPIRVGGKVSGRMGRTNFGGLVTSTGTVEDLVDGTGMGAFRVKQNILEQSSTGILATFGDPAGRSGSYTVGGDFIFNTSRFLGTRNLIVGTWGMVTGREDLNGDQTAFGFIVDYPNDVWDLWVSYKRIGDGFDPSLGFVPRKGVHLANMGVNYRLWSPTTSIRNLYFELVPILAWDLSGKLESYRIFTAPVNVRFESGDRFEFNVQPQGERLPVPFEIAEGVVIPVGTYDWMRYRAELDLASKRLVSGRVSWWFGPFYDGDLSQLSARIAINPSDFVNVELTGTRNDGSLPAGDFVQEILGARIGLNFSPDLQLSSLVQYERELGEVGANTRLRWTFHPLGDLFVVYNYNALDSFDQGWQLDTSQLIVKVQYAFRY
jgi:hypothetical protein